MFEQTNLVERLMRKPFLLGFVKGISRAEYQGVARDAKAIKDCYDPYTQTSNIPHYAGSYLTYSDTTTGMVFTGDDTRQSDT